MKTKTKKHWVSEEYVSEIKKSLFHVWQTGITHSVCIDAFEDESCATTYCNLLNKS